MIICVNELGFEEAIMPLGISSLKYSFMDSWLVLQAGSYQKVVCGPDVVANSVKLLL